MAPRNPALWLDYNHIGGIENCIMLCKPGAEAELTLGRPATTFKGAKKKKHKKTKELDDEEHKPHHHTPRAHEPCSKILSDGKKCGVKHKYSKSSACRKV
jgi:hypothetical protein